MDKNKAYDILNCVGGICATEKEWKDAYQLFSKSKREHEIQNLNEYVDGFSKEFETKLLNMSDKEFEIYKTKFTEDMLTPNFNI